LGVKLDAWVLRRACTPLCAPQLKAIKTLIILDAFCTLNDIKITKTHESSLN